MAAPGFPRSPSAVPLKSSARTSSSCGTWLTDMDPEDGCLWIYRTDDQQTIAFTPAGMEYSAGAARRAQTQSVIPAVLSGWLRLGREAS